LVKELIQKDLEVNALIESLAYVLSDEGSRHLIAGYKELRLLLGERGASQRAAEIIRSILSG
jgi:lipid A disaccharide synthetase